MPFNEDRFRLCMAQLASAKGRDLSQLYSVKLVVLVDLFHLLRCGKPAIGGSVAPWELGPVIEEAYRTCTRWRTEYDHFGHHPPGFKVVGRDSSGKMKLRAIDSPDPDEFSRYELDAMEQAWAEIGHLNYPALHHYTHSPDTFLGSAYVAAREAGRLMDWNEIIAAYDRFRGEDHTAIQALLRY